MKVKWMMMAAAMASAAMLYANEAVAWSPGSDYPCKVSHFENNLKNAKYIVVARLEKYLPDYKGEYRVLMNLRGDIQPETLLVQNADPEPQTPEAKKWTDDKFDPLGQSYIFLAEEMAKENGIETLKPFQCDGRFSASFKDEHGRPGLDPIINYIIEGK